MFSKASRASRRKTGSLPAPIADYLNTVSWLHYPLWSHRFFPKSVSTNFPGVVVLALASVAVVSRSSRRDPRVLMCAAVAAGCALVPMAPRLPGYEHLHNLVPLFWIVRVQAHMGQVVLLALAVLAGFGIAQARAALGRMARLAGSCSGGGGADQRRGLSCAVAVSAIQR